MKRELEILDELREACEERKENDYTAHAFAVVGNKDEFKFEFVGDPRDLGETLYFICSENKQMLEIFASAVRVARSLEEGCKEETKE